MFRCYIHTFWVGAAFALACCSRPQKPDDRRGKALLLAPDTVVAGRPLKINVPVQNIAAGEVVYIMCQGSWGTRLKEVVAGGNQDVMFTDSLSGMLTLHAVYHNRLLAEKKVMVAPLLACEPLDTYLGTKSVIANGKDWAMVTSIPTDGFGNLVKEGTETDFDLLRPDKRRERYGMNTHGGIAYHIITAGTLAGKTFAGVSVQGVGSKEKELHEVAGFPAGFTLSAENNSTYADSRQTFKIKTSVLKDAYGNIVPEGTAVVFECRDANGAIRQLNGYTLDGVAGLHIRNPVSAGDLSVIASVFGGGKSEVLTLPFTNAFQDIPVAFNSASKRLAVGILRGKLNQLVPNGTIVMAVVDGQIRMESETVDGMAGFDVADLPKGGHRAVVTVFETSKEIEFKIR